MPTTSMVSHGPTDPPPSLSPSLSVSISRLLCSICVCTKKTQMPKLKGKMQAHRPSCPRAFSFFFHRWCIFRRLLPPPLLYRPTTRSHTGGVNVLAHGPEIFTREIAEKSRAFPVLLGNRRETIHGPPRPAKETTSRTLAPTLHRLTVQLLDRVTVVSRQRAA